MHKKTWSQNKAIEDGVVKMQQKRDHLHFLKNEANHEITCKSNIL